MSLIKYHLYAEICSNIEYSLTVKSAVNYLCNYLKFYH